MNFLAICVQILTRARAWVREIEFAAREESRSTDRRDKPTTSEDLRQFEMRATLSFDSETLRLARAESSQQQKVQNSTKNAAWAAFISASIYVAVSLGMWREMRIATKAATNAAQIARDTLIASERPWLTATVTFVEPPHAHSAGPGITFLKDGSATMNIYVVLKNIGHSPATRIYVDVRMFPPPFTNEGITEPIRRQREWCAHIRSLTPNEDGLQTLFPQDDITENETIPMTKTDIDTALTSLNVKLPGQKFLTPIIFGCVNYSDALSKETHQTGFMYQTAPIHPEGSVSGADLEIFKYPFGGTFGN